jgi:hypothetical protein
MPTVIALRSPMGILWALERGALIEAERFLMHLSYLCSAVGCWRLASERLVTSA